MRHRALLRHSVAAVAAATLLAGLGPLAPLAVAAEDTGIVLPTAVAAQPRQVIPLAAGPNGYLRYEQGLGQFWTTYAGVETIVHNDLEGSEADGTYGAGSDVVAAFESSAPYSGRVRLWDVTGRDNSYVALPSGAHRYIGTFGTTVVTVTRSAADAPPTWHLLRLVSGKVQDTVVTGWPAGSVPAAKAVTGDAKGILSGYTADGVTRPVWIDLATAQVRPVAPERTAPSAGTVHTATEVAEWGQDGVVRFHAKGGVDASGPLAETATVPLAYRDGDVLLGLVGQRLIVGRLSGQGGSAPYRIVSVPRTGGEETELLGYGRKDVMATPDGGLLVVGGVTADGLALTRISAQADGTALTKLSDVTPLTSKPRSLSFSHGRLESFDRMPDDRNAYRSRTVSVTGPLAAGTTELRGDLGLPVDDCTDRYPCEQPLSTGDGRVVINRQAAEDGPAVVADAGSAVGRPISTAFSSFRAVDVSGRYAVGSGTTTDGVEHRSIAVDLDTGEPLASFPVGWDFMDVDLYGDTLWAAGKTAGSVVGYDVRTGAAKRTVSLGDCTRAEFLHVTSHWLGYSCPAGASGIHDLDTNVNHPYDDAYSVLGDGYVVRTSGDLTVTDIRGAQPVAKGTYRVSDYNDQAGAWAVDVATGRLAYQENGAGDIRVVDPGVPASPLARIDADVPAAGAVAGGAGSWTPRWWLSKPAASWTLTLTHKATGTVVRTLTGGEARGVIAAAWDGKDGTGALAVNGAYAWKLTATPADGSGAALQEQGEMLLSGALASPYGTFSPVTPTRLMDTRSGLGVPKAKVGPGATVSLKVTGVGGVPAANVSAVVLNVTATAPTSASFVSVYPYGTQRTAASNLNFTAGRTVPNLVVVPVKDGKVSFYNRYGSVDLLADVAGYYTSAGTGTTYAPVTPARLMDTRSGLGVRKGKLGPAGTVTLPVTEPGASAVVLNVTATAPTSASFVSVYPYGTQRTAASNLNFTAGQTVPNLVVVPVKDGKVTFYNHAGSVDLIADVAGYFKPGAAGSEYRPVTPERLMDTRSGLGVPQGPLGAGRTVDLAIDRPGALAVVLNVTATAPTSAGFVSVYPYGTQRAAASNLNFTAGLTVPNLVVVPVKDGKVTFYNHAGSVHLIADIAGYYLN